MQMGFSYDWSREIDSSEPEYYKWTQWFFTLLFQKGLAYRKESIVNWDPVDKTVLANEQVVNGIADRSGAKVEKIPLAQWFFKITDYADRLANDLEDLDWSDSIKSMQRNWIGKSQGMLFDAPVKDTDLTIQTFSAHFEAFAADTFVVIAPDHPRLKEITKGVANQKEVLNFASKLVTERDTRGFTDEEHVEGIFTGRYIEDPVGNGDLPIWVASYALADYGTGIVKCSAHDERDFRFAKKYNIPLKPVLFPIDPVQAQKVRDLEICFTDMKNGVLTAPGAFVGKVAGGNRQEIINYLEHEKIAQPKVNYKIRDWLISRQRYWGAPIPMVWVEKSALPKGGADFIKDALEQNQTKTDDGKELIAVPVPESQLPVVLPEVDSYQPDGSGKGPLARAEDWVHVWLNVANGETKSFKQAKAQDGWVEGWRETDTMDGFACSSWYFLRFADPHNTKAAFDPAKIKFWLPVDDYIGGAEHAVMHLLYARMWTKVLFDAGMIEFDEPFKTLRNQGMILAPDNRKMSKSWGNVIAPDEIIEQGYGADAIRLMELFIGPWNQSAAWSVEGMGGCFRFLQRVWTLAQEYLEQKSKSEKSNPKLVAATHKAIKKVSQDMQDLGFNTSIAALMEFVNELYRIKAQDGFVAQDWPFALESLLHLLAPFAPHISEELWQQLGHKDSLHTSQRPQWDEKYLLTDTIKLAVQVNGKLRAEIEVATGSDQEFVVKTAQANHKVKIHLANKKIMKTIYVPGRLVSFVVS
jgi:leucyl-tRNA synthetase